MVDDIRKSFINETSDKGRKPRQVAEAIKEKSQPQPQAEGSGSSPSSPAPTNPQQETYDKAVNDIISRVGREYVHSIVGANLIDNHLLIIPFDPLQQTRVALVLDENAINTLEQILEARKIKRSK